MSIIFPHPNEPHSFAVSLHATDEKTTSGTEHRALTECGHNDVLVEHMIPALQNHHISADALARRKDLLQSLRLLDASVQQSPFPRADKTRKGNFAEVFLAEYLGTVTNATLPVYRLRYNPNVEQSMKGDDVLLFDLDVDPVRIIVGEAKFRSLPSSQAIIDTINGLVRSNRAGLPISLMFVAERLFDEGNPNLAQKVQQCAILFATNQLHIDYVGLLMSNHNAKANVNQHTPNELHNLIMISLGICSPDKVVQSAFDKLEGNL